MAGWLLNCKPCGPCGGKWNAAQAQMFWQGSEPFTSLVTCSPVCPGGPILGGSKYLTKRVYVSLQYSQDNSRWVYDGMTWNFESGFLHYAAVDDNTTTKDRLSGCPHPTGSRTETGPTASGSLFDCTGVNPTGWYITPYPGPGGGTIKPLDVWGQIVYHCASYACFDGFGNIYASGPNIVANAPADWTVVEDTPTAIHLGFLATRDYVYTNPTYPPGTPPSYAGSVGEVVCAHVEVHHKVQVTIDLSSEYTYASLVGETYALLSYYNLRLTDFKDMPVCPSGWSAGPSSTAMPLLTRKYTVTPANVPLDYVCPDGIDGSVVFGYVRGTEESPAQLTWGAFEQFDASGEEGQMTVQKWVMRQGKYKPWRWQDVFPKTWRFLLLQWTADFCSGAATFHCDNKTGGEAFVMCVSPNADFPPVNTFWFSTPFSPERIFGNDRQMLCKDSMSDTYPDPSCSATPISSDAVEPIDCDNTCPGITCCAAPGAGSCPPNPPDDWP
jgi:hypothetical protein